MAFSLFGNKKKDDGKPEKQDSDGFKRDVRKSKRFFEHARTVADARNYDYAIDLYIKGLKYDPDNLAVHEELFDVAKRRKVADGKPAGFMEGMKSGGKTAVDKMLHAEMLLAKDPLNVGHMLSVLDKAVEVYEDASIDADTGGVVEWLGKVFLDTAAPNKKVTKAQYIEAKDSLVAVESFELAAEACRRAVQLSDGDSKLLRELKEIEASQSSKHFTGSSRESVRDMDKQRDLEIGDSLSKTGSAMDEQIARRRVEYDEDPQDQDRAVKLINALVEKGTSESEAEAMQLLNDLWQQSGQYRFKTRIGDIRMRQFSRELREMQTHLKENPGDAQTKEIMVSLAREQLQFELEEFRERVQNYPTDMGMRYQYGRRLLAVKKYDEAIAEFQQARSDPKFRSQSLLALGKCYLGKEWTDEAIDALNQGIEQHQKTGDKLELEMKYELMLALKNSASSNGNADHAQQAQKLASEILQTDIKYRDIQKQLEEIRELSKKLSGSGTSA